MAATVFQMRSATNDEAETCCNCGVEFASPVLIQRLKDGKSFWCPNGHSQHYTKTTEQKLREELEVEKRRRLQAESDAEWQRSVARSAQVATTKAKNKLARSEKRIAAGVCIHCNRTFKQLAAHMKCKHLNLIQP